MRYELINEFEVSASVDDVWEVYSSPILPKLIVDLLPGMFERIDFVEENGGLGIVLRLVYPPGTVPRTYKEKFTTIDKNKRLKEVKQIERGYLDMGVSFYMDSFEIIKKVGLIHAQSNRLSNMKSTTMNLRRKFPLLSLLIHLLIWLEASPNMFFRNRIVILAINITLRKKCMKSKILSYHV
ncbi:hypothetical protein C5167_011489 [Papaver somniferum]|uniref:Bet v I/Major latex protein domain-containing protein n=1 Tax=Papaver somniferum TaxID=3469 RepID=A0A4Y7K787_PAPSO|nr:hypothetical protein C5167_011489 [Papaver somniferum]